MIEWRPAPAVERVAGGVPIRFVFRSRGTRRKGRVVAGRARVVTGLHAFLVSVAAGVDAADFFVIEIAEDVWGELTSHQQAALVDHELEHCAVDRDEYFDELVLSTTPHDVEEFIAVMRRHGAWTSDLAALVGAASMCEE